MSQYEYYHFLRVDRPLNDEQISLLRSISPRVDVTPTSLLATSCHEYEFQGSPRDLMETYFDAFIYVTNYGAREVMFRLPRTQIPLGLARQYCIGPHACAWASGPDVVLRLTSDEEATTNWAQPGPDWMASIALVRSELASGDHRALYLVWLLSAQQDLNDDTREPRVPSNLRKLTGPQHSLIDFMRIDRDLVAVGATASAQSSSDGHAKGALGRSRHYLRTVATFVARRRTVEQLRSAADIRQGRRARRDQQAWTEQRARRARTAAVIRDEHLEDVARREDHIWQQVFAHIETGKPHEYDTGVQHLVDLRAASTRHERRDAFNSRLAQFVAQHRRKPRLRALLDRAGLGEPTRL